MATLEIKKIRIKENSSLTYSGKIITVEEIRIIDGKIYFLPKNKAYQYLELTTDNCDIIN